MGWDIYVSSSSYVLFFSSELMARYTIFSTFSTYTASLFIVRVFLFFSELDVVIRTYVAKCNIVSFRSFGQNTHKEEATKKDFFFVPRPLLSSSLSFALKISNLYSAFAFRRTFRRHIETRSDCYVRVGFFCRAFLTLRYEKTFQSESKNKNDVSPLE